MTTENAAHTAASVAKEIAKEGVTVATGTVVGIAIAAAAFTTAGLVANKLHDRKAKKSLTVVPE